MNICSLGYAAMARVFLLDGEAKLVAIIHPLAFGYNDFLGRKSHEGR
jgi:hypothetical protein